jgi:hypothetical protein
VAALAGRLAGPLQHCPHPSTLLSGFKRHSMANVASIRSTAAPAEEQCPFDVSTHAVSAALTAPGLEPWKQTRLNMLQASNCFMPACC